MHNAGDMRGLRRLTFALLWVTLFVIPWENVAKFEGVGTISRLAGIAAAGAGLLTVLVQGEVRRPGPFLWAAAAFAGWNALTLFWTIDVGLSLQQIFTYAQLLVLVWLMGEFAASVVAVRALMLAYVLGAAVSAASTVRNYTSGRETTYLRYAAFNFDSNDLGLILALGVPLAWYLLMEDGRRLVRWAAAAYLPLALVGVLLTASRGAFLATVVAVSIVAWTFRRLGFRARVLVGALAVLTGAGVLTMVPATSWRRLSTIRTEVGAGTMNQRTEIWEAGADVFPESPLLGVGSAAFRTAVETRLGIPQAAHNAFLGVLVDAGIVGLALFCTMLAVAMALIRRFPPLERTVWLVVGATWLVGVMSLSWEYRKPTWVMFGLLAAHAAALGRAPRPDRAAEFAGERA
ncbi:MAG TPA: O-antigen ligase family protein [Gemmatimonadaceae bacterium]|nr:O-antigen ligase family protein [Gemmatimonadaceae bacterium]